MSVISSQKCALEKNTKTAEKDQVLILKKLKFDPEMLSSGNRLALKYKFFIFKYNFPLKN